jgi:cysteinyl-tRNA synthetase
MRLFDTLTGRKRDFTPLGGKTVRMYTCGPSVYAYSHIGNFRTYLFEDVLVKYLRYKGYRVMRVMNITDVEDKAIVTARKEGLSLSELQRDKTRSFFSDWDDLSMERPDIVAKASEHVPQMIALIERICAQGYCKKENSGVYFDVRKFKSYGKLRHLKKPRYFGKVARDDYAKEGLWDFRLWKRWTRGDAAAKWKSPFGAGRPGWHIECSAISMHYLGESFDIHCGGIDNIYPHHENEIAQSEVVTGKPPVNFWLHAKHLTIGKKKMSKRTGNVLYVKQIEDMGISPSQLRFYLISERYRKPLDFTIERFKHRIQQFGEAMKTLKALRRLAGKSIVKRQRKRLGPIMNRKILCGFEGAMDDDLNTRLAFKRLFCMLGKADECLKKGKLTPRCAHELLATLERIDNVLGVFHIHKTK